MGDFNSRTHNKEDFTNQDNVFAKHFDFDESMNKFF